MSVPAGVMGEGHCCGYQLVEGPTPPSLTFHNRSIFSPGPGQELNRFRKKKKNLSVYLDPQKT